MKWIVIYIILKQVCSPIGTGYEAPPYFYAHIAEDRASAQEYLDNLPEGQQGFLMYGYPQFNPSIEDVESTNAERSN